MPTHEQAMVSEARRVARAQTRITRLNRELKEARAELRLAKKNLKALARETVAQQTPPMRLFGER